MRGLRFLVLGVALLTANGLRAAECPGNPDAIGTSRTIVVDPAEHPRLGGMQYHESLPLQDHEVVLTFDDGPLPPHTNRILDILASECVKATYFMVGKMARNYPDLVRRIYEAGHTIGTHSYDHPLSFHKMPLMRAEQEIEDGIESVNWALGGTKTAPFFRIPGLLRAVPVERYLASRDLQVWSADFPADDWARISSNQVYERALKRLEANHKGILLLHDIHARTVDALPRLLKELKRRGYHIVHVVPATAERPKTETAAADWVLHNHKVWPGTPVEAEGEPEQPAPTAASVEASDPSATQPPVQASGRRHRLAHGHIPLPPIPAGRRHSGLSAPFQPATPMMLQAPTLDELGFEPAPAPLAAEPKTSFDLVPETKALGIDVRRAFARDPASDEQPTGSLAPAPPSGTGPTSNATR
jgi:peptidoglycan-N-acetylglucosamine deacetylase